jgi:hypothetical protein
MRQKVGKENERMAEDGEEKETVELRKATYRRNRSKNGDRKKYSNKESWRRRRSSTSKALSPETERNRKALMSNPSESPTMDRWKKYQEEKRKRREN